MGKFKLKSEIWVQFGWLVGWFVQIGSLCFGLLCFSFI